MAKTTSFRIGRVTVYQRGKVWYLRYHEQGRRRQVRGGPQREAVRQLAAQVNAQLEVGVPAATSFEPVSIPELRQRWLDHHEHVRRSSVATLNRYRTASEHLLRFIEQVQPVRCASHFRASHAEAFVRYLRSVKVAPNGHPKTAKRPLRDKGVKYVLEVCRTLFQFAGKRRHLPPYADNPFTMIEIDRIPVEDSRPFVDLDGDQQKALLVACDDWQLPIFATLLLTGLRVGELTHLLVEDVDLNDRWLHVRNKPELGWQIKTRGERQVPLVPVLAQVLGKVIGDRTTGPVFLRRRFTGATAPPLAGLPRPALVEERRQRLADAEAKQPQPLSRAEQQRLACHLWRDIGAMRESRLRMEFMRLTTRIDLPHLTTPKTLRHLFATALQDANVDPLIRNEVMGHAPAAERRGQGPLAMTTTYTHTRPATLRRQVEAALATSPACDAVQYWVTKRSPCLLQRRSYEFAEMPRMRKQGEH